MVSGQNPRRRKLVEESTRVRASKASGLNGVGIVGAYSVQLDLGSKVRREFGLLSLELKKLVNNNSYFLNSD
jgi:hypothetical protein